MARLKAGRCSPPTSGRPNASSPPRDASLTFLVQFSHFICGPSGEALARPGRRGCGTGAVRAARRPPFVTFPLSSYPGREGRSPSRSQCGPRGGVVPPRPSRVRPAAGERRAPPASRLSRHHRGDGRADGAESRRTERRTWPRSLAFPPGHGAASAPRRRQPPARRLPTPPRGGAHCGPEPRHVATAAAAAVRVPGAGRARSGGPRRAPVSPRRAGR